MQGCVISVGRDLEHRFSKPVVDKIVLEEGLGIVGDAHAGATVQHRTLVARDPTRMNKRQVHLINEELFEELRSQGFTVKAGDLGENVLTRGLDLLALPAGTILKLGLDAEIELTGLRNPCRQIDGFQPGLKSALLFQDEEGKLRRKAGVMAIVRRSGVVSPGDAIAATLPEGPFRPLEIL